MAEEYVDIPGPYMADFTGGELSYGMRYRFTGPGLVTGVRYLVGDPVGGPGSGVALWTETGTELARASGPLAPGFTNVYFTAPVPVDAGADYIAGFWQTSEAQRHYKLPPCVPADSGHVHCYGGGEDGKQQGYYGGGAGNFPNTYWSGSFVPCSPIFTPPDEAPTRTNTVADAVRAVAAALDGWALDGNGGNQVRAFVGPADGGTPPFAVVEAVAAQWADIGRSDGTANLNVDVDVYLPHPAGAVAGALANAVLSGFRDRLRAAGKTLGGTVHAWRMVSGDVGPLSLGGRSQPAVQIRLDLWLPI